MMTDNDIKKALECCSKSGWLNDCDGCPCYDETEDIQTSECQERLMKNALDLINRLEAENSKLFYTLTGVVQSVDKFLDDDELKQDEVNRASLMREKVLQSMERQQAEIDKLQHKIMSCNTEIERLNKENDRLSQCVMYHDGQIVDAKSEAIKEFAERLETALDERASEKIRERNPHWYLAKRIVRETAIEMTEVQE